jgi:hypothetical protein
MALDKCAGYIKKGIKNHSKNKKNKYTKIITSTSLEQVKSLYKLGDL